jgi:DNA gyrase subunit B
MFPALKVSIGIEDDSKALNLSKIRYHKVIIMTDADVAGSHITTLILTLFFRHMQDLIQNECLSIATPPLCLEKRGHAQRYCWNEEERLAAVEELGKGRESGVTDTDRNLKPPRARTQPSRPCFRNFFRIFCHRHLSA